MFTILWCYLRNACFKKDGVDYHNAADLTGQANHLGVTLGADIIKQKLPTNNGGYTAINFGHTSPLVYDHLTSNHPIDLTRYQVANCYMGRIGLINSGGPSGKDDLKSADCNCCHQQASWWHGFDLRPKGVSKANGRRDKTASCHSRCLLRHKNRSCIRAYVFICSWLGRFPAQA